MHGILLVIKGQIYRKNEELFTKSAKGLEFLSTTCGQRKNVCIPLQSVSKQKHLNYIVMAVTTLKRKLRRKRQSQNTRVARIKQLSAQPVIKNVDVEELKKSFDKK
ncbi:hypothetical protein [Algoriphagus sp.]|nr:hypothetical protein [Algoriphagus sp.]